MVKATILVDGTSLYMNAFITSLVSNLVEGVRLSLKAAEGGRVEFRLEGEEIALTVDGREVPLQVTQGRKIVGDLFRALIRNLHGTENGTVFQFICEPS